MKKIIVAAVVFIAINCKAQDAPSSVKGSFAKSFPGITVKKWYKEDGGYEANFTQNGKKVSATFSADGTLKETETDIKTSELPASVTEYIKSNYKGATAKEAAIIVKGSSKMYEAEVKGMDLLFDMNGKFLKEEED